MLFYEPTLKFQKHERYEDECEKGQTPFFISREGESNFEEFKKTAQWTLIEKTKYAAFLEFHAEVMEGKPSRKLWELFVKMSEIIKTRNFRQCKSLHQKLLSEHKSISGILSALLKSVPKFNLLLAIEKDKLNRSKLTCPNVEVNEYFTKEDKGEIIGILPTGESYYPENQEKVKLNPIKQNSFGHFPIIMNLGMKKEDKQNQEWRKCHELFIEWSMRLRELLRSESYY